MGQTIYNQLQLREIFHLEFLRWLTKKASPENYALKGGVNLRFFFNSFRYSEDMDLDISGVKVEWLKDTVMKILTAVSFQETLKSFGIEKVLPPDISKAKQTETTQRFKVHLLTYSGEDLFTKVEFSRRGFKGETITQPVSDNILRAYKMPPLLIPHYSINSAIAQKIEALVMRAAIQARDVFDLYILTTQYEGKKQKIGQSLLIRAKENVSHVTFNQFRDTAVSYLSSDDQLAYAKADAWDAIKIRVSNFIEEIKRNA
ncbi:MAG: nucleotidyl transferase AbiEii/AbiGii toxin family protein [Candidatus Omnitrophota bacterium]